MPKFVGRLLLCLTTACLALAVVAAPVRPALAQQNNDKPAADQAQQAAAKQDAADVDEYLEAQHQVSGPAGNPECVKLGSEVVALLWNNDIDTAFRHLDLYDRFGCPAAHIQAAFRCILLHPPPRDPKPPADSHVLDKRAHACWVNPSAPVTATATPPVTPPAAAASTPPAAH